MVKPYLANKKDKTFLDHWLLDDDWQAYLDPWQFDRLNTVERVLLAQRIAGEGPKTARHLNDLFGLTPANMDRFRTLFETAVAGKRIRRGRRSDSASCKSETQLKDRCHPGGMCRRQGVPAGPVPRGSRSRRQ